MIDPSKQHDDLRLLRMAVRKRWDIPEEFRRIAVQRLAEIVDGGDDEIALKAIAEARHMEAQNQKDEHAKIDEFNQRLLGLAERCGIDIALLGFGSAADCGAEGGDVAPAIPIEDRA